MVKPKRVAASTTAVPLTKSMAMRYSYQVEGLKGKKLLQRFKEFHKATVYKHAQKPLEGELVEDKRIASGIGRPSKLSRLDGRNIEKAIRTLREREGQFNSKRVGTEAGLDGKCSNRTVRRCMNRKGYHYLNARKKGQLSKEDEQRRLKWARENVKNGIKQSFWSYGVSIYMDAVGFIYKKNALNQARAPKGKVWRKISEGLTRNCTGKLNKAGTRQVKFMVGISYNRGVVLCESYENLNGKKCSKMFDQCLPQAFQLSVNPTDKKYLQDGCPVQNSKVAMQILEDIGAELVPIPPRSPDLNPIENLFAQLGKQVELDSIAKKITNQTFEEFEARVRQIIVNYDSKEMINKL